jgi:hypothetical protein
MIEMISDPPSLIRLAREHGTNSPATWGKCTLGFQQQPTSFLPKQEINIRDGLNGAWSQMLT